jgi:secreted trypsin-like serine protease
MKTRTSAAAAVGVFAAVMCVPGTAEAIVGGEQADQPYPVGSLQYDNGSDPDWPTCGVWIHDAWHVATNAHCVTNMPASGARARSARLAYGAWAATEGGVPVDHGDPSIYHIRLGSPDRTSGGQVYHVRAIVVPDSWAWGVQDAEGRVGDVALLTLDRPVHGLDPALTPAMLRPLDEKGSVREVGWGTTADDAAQPARVLHQLDVSPLARSACDSGPALTGIDEICLDHAPGGGGACHGDSGTAAFQRVGGRRWAAVGSAGRTGAGRSVPCSQSPAVYTNLAYYATWFWQHQQLVQ